MKKNVIPIPICSTCKASGSDSYISGDNFCRCSNCGTEMRYLPAGELLITKGSDVKKNNGWITKFSVVSAELYTGRAMNGIGTLIMVLALSFYWFGRLELDGVVLSGGSGLLLAFIGQRRTGIQKRKVQMARDNYPYWQQ
ncbi:MAG: hypothetical protein H8E79_05605 [Desulfobulbaceae bacterium]|uniref:Uncharacterized protein n=1 Tax=Candidatus Desulfatifera sulfidica TaxID=2841691 RepID=A0A8J6NAV5_9BACT|nr:hypothetical protein [Candidatus Desulfatifera sulfidica]